MTDDPDQPLVARAENLKTSHLLCRTIGHSWKPQAAVFYPKIRAYYTAYRCTRCRTERVAWLDSQGRPTSGGGSRYNYPEGYVMPGVGHLDTDDRGVLRLAALSRLGVVEAPADDDGNETGPRHLRVM